MNSDTITSVTLNSAGAAAAAAVGSYPIAATNALGTGLSNYLITYVPGALTVVAANSTNITMLASSRTLQLSWPADHTGWWLQAQSNNLGTNWFNVAGSTMTNTMFLPVDAANQNVFYRLVSP